MDPNVCLENIRCLVRNIMNNYFDIEEDVNVFDVLELSESFNDLDHWIEKGGFLPKQWIK